MPRPVSNPPNPWAGPHVEWLGEPPPARLEVYEEEAKSVLTRNDSPDVPFRLGVNPYRGCQHGCAYCYARRHHEFLDWGAGTDFETKVVVKVNAPEVLRRELARGGWRGEGVAFSGATDCYQPLEAHYELTRRCLEVAREFRAPVAVLTRGNLVRRDAGLLADLGRRAAVRVHLSVPTLDADLARALEPLAPAPSARLETMRQLSAAGVEVGVAVAPVIPGLTEHELPAILEAAAGAGARRAFLILLRLPGPVEGVFFERLQSAVPGRAARVRSALAEMRGGEGASASAFHERLRGSGPRWEVIWQLFRRTCARLGLECGEEGLEHARVVRREGRQGELFS